MVFCVTKGICSEYVLPIFCALTLACAALNRQYTYNAQAQIEAKYCLHHKFTYSGVSIIQCAARCVRSEGCRATVFSSSTQACLGCGYVMDVYYSDQYDIPVNISSGSVPYTPALSSYQYIGFYADCGPIDDPATSCDSGNRTLPLVVYDAAMTPEFCFNYCEQYGTRYFGTEAADYCLCGLVYDKYGTSNASTWACAGDSSQICGGPRALSVYESIIQN